MSRAAFIAGHPRPTFSRRDRVGNSGQARKSRRPRSRRLPLLELPSGWTLITLWAERAGGR